MQSNLTREIDQTLDQLIENAEAISQVELADLSEIELESFQKTQESLLQHLLHVDELLSKKQKESLKQHPRTAALQIQEKKKRFQELNEEFEKELKAADPIKFICKRKTKKVIAKSLS